MASKDQRSIEDTDSAYEKWDRGKTLFLESLYKPDDQLRSCAHNQKCYHELMEIRDRMIEIARDMPNPKPRDESPYNNIPSRY